MREIKKQLAEEATQMWERMQPQIRKLLSKAIPAASLAHEPQDLLYGVAWEACYMGLLKYRQFCNKLSAIKRINGNFNFKEDISELKKMDEGMKKTTFVFWYLQKAFFRETGDELRFIVVSPEGEFEVFMSREFNRKFNKESRKKLEANGYRILSDRLFSTFSELSSVRREDCKEKEIEFIDLLGEFDTWQVKRTNGKGI